MLDDNWDLINGEDAHEIEVLNFANQVNVIAGLFRLVTHHHGKGPGGCPASLNINALRELHRTGTLFLLEKPGEWREKEVHVGTGSVVIFQPPTFPDVPRLMDEFNTELRRRWDTQGPVQIAAYALWRINWIHPFSNGNGRTARAFAYACMQMKYGFELPGSPTVIDLISENREDLCKHLRHADLTLAATGVPDLAPVEAFLEALLVKQLSSIDPSSAATPPA